MSCWRTLQTVLLSVLLIGPAGEAGSAEPASQVTPVQTPLPADTDRSEILWDTWGVPHIFATTAAEAGYGYGWAQMHNHGNRLLRLYALARGRAAEYWGRGISPVRSADPNDGNSRRRA